MTRAPTPPAEIEAKPSLPAKGPGFAEFVCLIAVMMALNALAIDAMLPALPHIGQDLGVTNENSRQWIITAYLLGFGGAQLFYGPLSDRYGRRPVLFAGIGVYVAFSVLAAFAHSFDLLILSRVGMGVGAAATRVLAVSIVRDRYVGRTMARVMSLSFLVFLGVPIIAPAVGQMIMLVAPWPWIFGVFALSGGAFLIWAGLRLPETLHPEDRMPINLGRIAGAFRFALTHRQGMGYTLAMTVISGALFGFINSSQQIFFDVFKAPGLDPERPPGREAGLAPDRAHGPDRLHRLQRPARRHRVPGPRQPVDVRRAAGLQDVLLRLHRRQFRRHGHGADGPYRGHGLLRPGLHLLDRRGPAGLRHRPAVRRFDRADDRGLRSAGRRGVGAGAGGRERTAVQGASPAAARSKGLIFRARGGLFGRI